MQILKFKPPTFKINTLTLYGWNIFIYGEKRGGGVGSRDTVEVFDHVSDAGASLHRKFTIHCSDSVIFQTTMSL